MSFIGLAKSKSAFSMTFVYLKNRLSFISPVIETWENLPSDNLPKWVTKSGLVFIINASAWRSVN